ncbi:MAG: HWE histidine kinase domain-containing protein [Janthinobacterium lividum]
MSDDASLRRAQALEHDNARLRRLLDHQGSTAGHRHQMRNTLAMVRDIVRQSVDRFAGAEDYAAHLESRLDAVFRIQQTIADRPFDGVDLHTLVMDELVAYSVNEGEQLSIDGPDIQLLPAAASTLGLALHELATNAVEFGAVSAPAGRISVSWTTSPGEDGRDWLTLRWTETGVEPISPSPHRRGFGTEVIEQALKYQFGGEGRLEFAPGGLRCTIRLPLSRWLVPPRAISDSALSDG